jgi:hypothetical protein
MNGKGSKWNSSQMFPPIQMMTMTVWTMMNFQLPMNPVTMSAILAPSGASSMIARLTGCRLGARRPRAAAGRDSDAGFLSIMPWVPRLQGDALDACMMH